MASRDRRSILTLLFSAMVTPLLFGAAVHRHRRTAEERRRDRAADRRR